MLKNIKWTQIIANESEIVRNSALYIIPIDETRCRLIYVDDVGNRRTLSAEAQSDKNYIHIQTVASTTWVINHNLGKQPTPSFHFASGKPMGSVDYEYISNSQIVAHFANPEIGSATLN